MSIDRIREIASMVEDIKASTGDSWRQILFDLYDDRVITGPELDQCIDRTKTLF